MPRKVPFVTVTEKSTWIITAVNVLHVESIEKHKGGTSITFASGATMKVLERFDSLLEKMRSAGRRRRK